ncbi:MAG: tRNA (adenosine(37)-N6)-threonylcarbamoyltransferase complex dimerization subunit type 1 TsaB [Gammaproteobacteria bacterium]|nr:MAG: tRNA (adenosine(37)-N6)-threonylcarbamoyltransferase complex dimerization subunit type 1 TsaB [Gammaproteobacteria bacterium]
MTRILAIEAATEACSAALLIDDTVHERFEVAPRQHVALMLPFVEALLSDAGTSLGQLDAVAFGRGPGSFTGVRIAAGITQGIAFGADLPVIPVSTLAALAQGAVREHGAAAVLAALDARMQEVYWGAFRSDAKGLVESVNEECVCAPENVECPQQDGWVGAGSGWDRYAGILAPRCSISATGIYAKQQPHAADVARLAARAFAQGEVLAPEQALPVYLRDNVAHKPKPKV